MNYHQLCYYHHNTYNNQQICSAHAIVNKSIKSNHSSTVIHTYRVMHAHSHARAESNIQAGTQPGQAHIHTQAGRQTHYEEVMQCTRRIMQIHRHTGNESCRYIVIQLCRHTAMHAHNHARAESCTHRVIHAQSQTSRHTASPGTHPHTGRQIHFEAVMYAQNHADTQAYRQ